MFGMRSLWSVIHGIFLTSKDFPCQFLSGLPRLGLLWNRTAWKLIAGCGNIFWAGPAKSVFQQHEFESTSDPAQHTPSPRTQIEAGTSRTEQNTTEAAAAAVAAAASRTMQIKSHKLSFKFKMAFKWMSGCHHVRTCLPLPSHTSLLPHCASGTGSPSLVHVEGDGGGTGCRWGWLRGQVTHVS